MLVQHVSFGLKSDFKAAQNAVFCNEQRSFTAKTVSKVFFAARTASELHSKKHLLGCFSKLKTVPEFKPKCSCIEKWLLEPFLQLKLTAKNGS